MNAVLRTAESLDSNRVHVIETMLNIAKQISCSGCRENGLIYFAGINPTDCIHHLKSRGYKICVTSLNSAKPINEIDFLLQRLLFGK